VFILIKDNTPQPHTLQSHQRVVSYNREKSVIPILFLPICFNPFDLTDMDMDTDTDTIPFFLKKICLVIDIWLLPLSYSVINKQDFNSFFNVKGLIDKAPGEFFRMVVPSHKGQFTKLPKKILEWLYQAIRAVDQAAEPNLDLKI
jgi:hypothetical protein